jgi:hypothetical protein
MSSKKDRSRQSGASDVGQPADLGSVTLSGCLPVPIGHGSIQPGI